MKINRNNVFDVINKTGLTPEKDYGQNYLLEPSICEKIISLLDIHDGESVLEINEYYEEIKYVTIYFIGNILRKGEQRLTPQEIKEGMEPCWLTLDEAIAIFSKHEAYRDIFEEKRGLYLREFVALTHIKM